MKEYRILFDARSSWAMMLSNMHKYFVDNSYYNIKSSIVFHNRFEKSSCDCSVNSYLLSDYWDEKDKVSTITKFCCYDSKITGMNLWNIIYADRFLQGQEELKILEQISYYHTAWTKILNLEKPDFVVSEVVTGIPNFILYHLCLEKGIEYLGFLSSKTSNHYFYTRDLFGTFQELSIKFESLQNRELDISENKIVDDFIKTFQSNAEMPNYMKIQGKMPSIKPFLNPLIWMKKGIKDIIMPFNNDHDMQMGGTRLKIYYNNFKYYLTASKCLRKDVFENRILSEKYILFPLHYQPEASTSIWAAYYSDQLSTIKTIARSIPCDYKLYVKEHSVFLGTKTLYFYKELKKLPNVRLINPFSSIYELIKEASVVIVLTSTTGLEAIFLQKPVIIFGSVFYDIAPNVIKVLNINDLPDYIDKAINNFQYDTPNWKKFIYAYLTSGYKTDLISSIYNYKKARENAESLCHDLLSEIAKYVE